MPFKRNLTPIALALFLLAIILFFLFAAEYTFTYVLVFLLFAVAAIPFIIASINNSFDLFEIIHMYVFIYFLYFGIRTIYILTTPQEYLSDFFVVWELLDRALLYTILGLIALLMGYYSKFPHIITSRMPELDFVPHNGRIIFTMLFLYILGSASRAFYLTFGRRLDYPAIYNLIDYFDIFCPWSLILAVIYYFIKKRSVGDSFFLWFVFLPIEAYITFLKPHRSNFLPLVFPPFIAYYYLRKKFNPVYLVIPILAMSVLIHPVVSILKPLGWAGSTPKFETLYSDIEFWQTEVSEGLRARDSSKEPIFHELMNRFHGIDSLTGIIAYTPEAMDFQYGTTIWAAFGFLIPKFIRDETFLRFLDMDVVSLGRRFAHIYYGASVTATTGVSITQVSELYLNFALYGIIIGMFLLGIFYRTFYLYFIKKNPHPFSLYMYIILLFWIVQPEYWFVHAYENFMKQFIFLLLILWFLNGGRLFKKKIIQPVD